MKTIYLVDSKEWYETGEQAQAYLNLMNQSYASGIVKAEDELLRKNLEQICDTLHEKICYIDLGPGDGKKTRFLCDAFHKAGKLSAYVAVDIQPEFLKIAEEIRKKFRIDTRALKMSFESFLDSEGILDSTPKFIYLGATYGNFLEGDIEPRLCRFMGEDDRVYLSSGLWPRNPEELAQIYAPSVEIFRPLIKKYGLKEGGKMKVRFNYYRKTPSIEQGYEVDDTFYVFGISRKPRAKDFKKQMLKYFEGDIFEEKTHKTHIGFLGQVKFFS